MSQRAYNFGAGPSTLPITVLREVQAELLDWQGSGLSILEVSHRSSAFQGLMHQAESDLRDLLDIPSHYHVLFLGGATRAQFAMVPMNLLSSDEQAGYVVSGHWSHKAYSEAQRVGRAYCLARATEALQDNTAYVYYTPNETVNGVYAPTPPAISETVPLVADMTSCLVSEPIQVSDFGLIFAGTQKNMGAAGLTLVIIRDDLLHKKPNSPLPHVFDYRQHVAHASLYATPPVFNCYITAKLLQWVKHEGGVRVLHQRNQEKARRLYDYLDASDFYDALVPVSGRSLMNVCFSIKNDTALETLFVAEASECGLLALNGHRSVGGLRASLYNAMPLSGVNALIDFMDAFARERA